MTNEFGQRVYPVIRYVIGILTSVRKGAEDIPGGKSVTSKLKTLLTQFDVHGSRSNEFDLAKRALVYWIDEVFINSTWKEADWWRNNPLERHFYDSRERAWRFFEKAAVARQFPNLDTLETYYLCACLGFWGKYRDSKSTATESEDAASPDDKQPPIEETWADLTNKTLTAEIPIRNPDKADEEPAPPDPSPASAPKPSTTWWGGDMEAETQKTWGLAHGSVDMSRRELERLAAGPSPRGADIDEPETLQEWIQSVYLQIAPTASEPYSPVGEPEEPGNAAPLTGRSARAWALLSVVMTGTFLLIVVVITLYRT